MVATAFIEIFAGSKKHPIGWILLTNLLFYFENRNLLL